MDTDGHRFASPAARAARTTEITRASWDRLPLLLTRSVVLEVTGLDARELRREIDAGRITPFRQTPKAKAKYRKLEIGRIIGLES